MLNNKVILSVVLMLFTIFVKGAELKAYFPISEGGGNTIKDEIGGLTGKITGGTWRDGKLYMSGNQSYIDLPGSKRLSNTLFAGPCTIELWFRPDDSKRYNTSQWLVGSGGESGPGFILKYSWHMFVFSSGKGNGVWFLEGGKGSYNLAGWNHLVGTVNSKGIAKIYVNGVDLNIKPKTFRNGQQPPYDGKCEMAISNDDIIIGGYGNHKDYCFKGGLAGIKFYKGALTSDEVSRHYAKGMSVAKVKLDGKLDEAIWKKAKVFKTFYLNGGQAKKAPVQTKAYITADDEYLYGAIECSEPNMGALQKKIKVDGNLGDVYRDDSIEFMLDADGDPTCYYHFIMNANGAHAQIYRIESGRITSDWDATKLWKSAAKKYKHKWIVEFAIPHAILSEGGKGICPNAKVNFARNRRAGSSQESSILKTGHYHSSSEFKKLSLNKIDADKYLVRVGQKQLETKQDEKGNLIATVKTSIVNNSKHTVRGEVNVSLENSKGDVASGKKSIIVNAGELKNISVSVSLKKPGAYQTKISFSKNSKVVAMRQFSAEKIKFAPLTVDLLKPFYRNNFYYTEKANEVIAKIKVNLGNLSGVKLRLAMMKKGKTVAQKEFSAKKGNHTYRLPLDSKFVVGRYQLKISVIGKSGDVLGATKIAVNRLPKAPGKEVRIVEGGSIYMDGKPFFPIYWSSDYDDKPVADGSNGREIPGTLERLKSRLDFLDSKGMKAVIALYGSSADIERYYEDRTELTPAFKQYLKRLVGIAKKHPATYGYWGFDEPGSTPGLKRGFLAKVYRYVRALDPYHPCIMTNNAISNLSVYADAQDILCPDPYAMYIQGGTSARGLDYQAYFLDEGRKVTNNKSSVGVVMQAFSYGDYTQKGGRAPSYVEFRSIAWGAIVHGAKSLHPWKYGKDTSEKYAQIRLGASYVFAEVNALANAVVAGELIEESPIVKEGVNYRILKYKGEFYIIVSNTGAKTLPVNVKLPKGCKATQLNIVSEGKASVSNGVIKDSVKPFASKIYTTSNKYGKLTKLSKIKSIIKKANGVYECKY